MPTSMPVQCRKVPTNVNFGMKDLFFFIVYVMMAVPIPQLMHAIFGCLVGQCVGMVSPASERVELRNSCALSP